MSLLRIDHSQFSHDELLELKEQVEKIKNYAIECAKLRSKFRDQCVAEEDRDQAHENAILYVNRELRAIQIYLINIIRHINAQANIRGNGAQLDLNFSDHEEHPQESDYYDSDADEKMVFLDEVDDYEIIDMIYNQNDSIQIDYIDMFKQIYPRYEDFGFDDQEMYMLLDTICIDMLNMRLYDISRQEFWNFISKDIEEGELRRYVRRVRIEKSLGSTHSPAEKLLTIYEISDNLSIENLEQFDLLLQPEILISDIIIKIFGEPDNYVVFDVFVLPINIRNRYDLEHLLDNPTLLETYYTENHNIPIGIKKNRKSKRKNVKNAILIVNKSPESEEENEVNDMAQMVEILLKLDKEKQERERREREKEEKSTSYDRNNNYKAGRSRQGRN